jgi:hypothetical protein
MIEAKVDRRAAPPHRLCRLAALSEWRFQAMPSTR